MIFEAAMLLFAGYDFELTENGEFYFIDRQTRVKRLATDEEMTLINAETIRLEDERRSQQWKELRIGEYLKKTPYEQLEMMADGTFTSWYQDVKRRFPKTMV